MSEWAEVRVCGDEEGACTERLLIQGFNANRNTSKPPAEQVKLRPFFEVPKKKNLTLWLVRGSKCAQDHGECSYSSLGALKIGVWKRYSKNRFFRPKMPIFGPKTLSNRLLRSPILMKSFSRVLFSPIIHPQF